MRITRPTPLKSFRAVLLPTVARASRPSPFLLSPASRHLRADTLPSNIAHGTPVRPILAWVAGEFQALPLTRCKYHRPLVSHRTVAEWKAWGRQDTHRLGVPGQTICAVNRANAYTAIRSSVRRIVVPRLFKALRPQQAIDPILPPS